MACESDYDLSCVDMELFGQKIAYFQMINDKKDRKTVIYFNVFKKTKEEVKR